jgi:uncharacterized membrane protein YphA (DoxX/SURF4 family)
MYPRKRKRPIYFNLGILILRLYLGISMIKMSSGYLFDQSLMNGLISFLDGLNWPLPALFAYSSQFIEFIAGIFILLGIRIAGIFLFFVLISAVAFAHGFRIFDDAMLPMTFAIMALVIALAGCGRLSLDHFIYTRKNKF